MRAFAAVTLGVACFGLAMASARAEQVVLFDIKYTHTNANDSHHGIGGAQLTQPDNWTAPINYAQGTIHFYQEVLTKPSDKDTIVDVCLISARGYGCIETQIYKTPGIYDTMRSMAGNDVYQRNQIAFNQKMRSIQLVLKTPAPTFINGGRPQSDYLPSMMRFVATLVAPGSTYVPPVPTAGLPFDAGVAPVADAGAADVAGGVDAGSGPTPGTGGAPASGAGGSSGSGGSSVGAGGTSSSLGGTTVSTGGTSSGSASGGKTSSGSGGTTPSNLEEGVSGGCNMGQGSTGTATAWLVALALLLVRRRRAR